MILALGSEELAKHWNVADPRHLAETIGGSVVENSGYAKALTILNFDLRLYMPGRQRRNCVSRDDDYVGIVQRTHLRRYLQPNRSIGVDVRSELQLDAVRPKLNSHGRGASAAPGLDHRERKFAAGEELGRLAVYRHQVWFSQNLEDALVLQVFYRQAKTMRKIEIEQVHDIADHRRGRISSADLIEGLRAILSRCTRPSVVPKEQQINAKLV